MSYVDPTHRIALATERIADALESGPADPIVLVFEGKIDARAAHRIKECVEQALKQHRSLR